MLFRFICYHCAKGKPIFRSLWNISLNSSPRPWTKQSKPFEETMRCMVRHSWPGNIRELQNYIARGVILSSDGVFEQPPLENCAPLEPELEAANSTLEEDRKSVV